MAIDELLQARGDLRLIQGQPLHPLPKATSNPPTKKPKQAAEGAQEYLRKQAVSGGPKATIADYNSTGKETEVVRSFVSKAGSNVSAGPSRPPAPVAGPSNPRQTAAGPSNVQSSAEASLCILCRTPANHKVKNCTAVKNKPASQYVAIPFPWRSLTNSIYFSASLNSFAFWKLTMQLRTPT
jgi:chromodomain-helicase-DNA-binding protein 4